MTATLRTARLLLDAPRESDIDAVYDACQDAEILRWIPVPIPYTHADAEFFVRSYVPHGEASGQFTVWALRADDAPLLGVVEVRKDEAPGSASLGSWLAPEARGRGYMREALTRVVDHSMAETGMGYTRLRWEHLLGNTASERLAESVGFAPSGVREIEFRGESLLARVLTLPASTHDRLG
ncbi:GNAT family N-acetyltransferase [Leifsonia poae]|uniref:GNAT family N-acetyltransferase n=1 Tax=Leifsonia poae TaxID=110933 RepID=UPI001CBCE036|nr:GNAT family N-acetyltransferase [Leifsonia poae]